MPVKCPKCQTENPSDSKYCKECAVPLPTSADISITRTLETHVEVLKKGTIFAGRYKIIEKLGTGGMGEVYRVKDEKLEEEMAIKVLKPEIAADRGMIGRFKNELKLARKIAHRNVCKMYDLNEEEDTHFITMEYVTGEDLKSYIRKKEEVSVEDAIYFAQQICEGLAEAHELGVVHRDLKPQNIMIDDKGQAKIMDFGIARSVESPGVTQTGVMIGTPDYISPEQAEGQKADQRSDIYSLGVILYEMVTGSVPFRGDTALSVALKHKAQLPRDPRKLNPGISEDLSRLILICMEKDRERRYQSAKDLLLDLRNIQEGLPLGTKIRPRRRSFLATLIRKKLFIPASVVALAVIGVIIWRMLPQKEGLPQPEDKPSLAIMYFKNNTGEEKLDIWREGFAELLFADLSQSKYIKVLPSNNLFGILRELDLLEARGYSQEDLERVADKGGVGHVLQGFITKAGENFRVNVTLQDMNTGEIIGSDMVEGRGEESFHTMVDELTRRIKTNFNLTPEQIAMDIDKEIGKLTTNSLEAYKYYIEGLKLYSKYEFRQSVQFFEKAVSVDPNFAMAYLKLSHAYLILDLRSEFKKHIKTAFELKDRVSERERYQIRVAYHRLYERDLEKTIEVGKELVELYPDDVIGHRNLGFAYLNLGNIDKSIEHFEKAIQEKVDVALVYNNLAFAYSTKGLYEKAIELLEYYIENFSDTASIRWQLAQNNLIQVRFKTALAEIERGRSLDPSDYRLYSLKGDVYLCQGDFVQAEREYQKLLELQDQNAHFEHIYKMECSYLLQGKFKKGLEEDKKGLYLAERLGDEGNKVGFHESMAYAYLKSGYPEEALKEIDLALDITVKKKYLLRQISVLNFKGEILVGMKSLTEAIEVSEELKKIIERRNNERHLRYYYHLLGIIELERQNFSEAIDLQKKAVSLSPPKHGNITAVLLEALALSFYKSGDLEKAREEFEKITHLTAGRIYYGDIYAKSFYMLGKIYEEKGWTGISIEIYEKFLELWRDADPGLPEVEDARKRLISLRSSQAKQGTLSNGNAF